MARQHQHLHSKFQNKQHKIATQAQAVMASENEGESPAVAPRPLSFDYRVVASGGSLKRDVELRDITRVDGGMYAQLMKSDCASARLLAPHRDSKSRALANTTVLENLQKQRNDYRLAEDILPAADDLAVDAAQRKRIKKPLLAPLDAVITILAPGVAGGDSMPMRVLRATGKTPISVELISSNIVHLHSLVCEQLEAESAGGSSSSRKKTGVDDVMYVASTTSYRCSFIDDMGKKRTKTYKVIDGDDDAASAAARQFMGARK